MEKVNEGLERKCKLEVCKKCGKTQGKGRFGEERSKVRRVRGNAPWLRRFWGEVDVRKCRLEV